MLEITHEWTCDKCGEKYAVKLAEGMVMRQDEPKRWTTLVKGSVVNHLCDKHVVFIEVREELSN